VFVLRTGGLLSVPNKTGAEHGFGSAGGSSLEKGIRKKGEVNLLNRRANVPIRGISLWGKSFWRAGSNGLEGGKGGGGGGWAEVRIGGNQCGEKVTMDHPRRRKSHRTRDIRKQLVTGLVGYVRQSERHGRRGLDESRWSLKKKGQESGFIPPQS